MINNICLSLSLFLMVLPGISQADAGAGKGLFDSKGCGSCHYTEGPAREKSIADQLRKRGPELWYAGSKFNGEWLEKWLKEPAVIRPMAYNSLTEKNRGDHPALSADDAKAVAGYLLSLKAMEAPVVEIKPKKSGKGKLIFSRTMPCSGCHQYVARKKVTGGLTGPSLVGAGDRLRPEWIYAYLSRPKSFKPVRMMPDFSGHLSEKEVAEVAAYIATFR